MARKHPSRASVVQHEADCWDLAARGWSNRRIARKLGLSHEGVRKILARVESRVLKRLEGKVEKLKVRHDAQYCRIIEQNSLAWDKSRKPGSRVIQTTGPNGEPVTRTEAVERTGDPSFLRCQMDAMERRERLWGAHVLPAENTHTTIADIAADMHERARAYEQRQAELHQQHPELGPRRDNAQDMLPDTLHPGTGGGAQ